MRVYVRVKSSQHKSEVKNSSNTVITMRQSNNFSYHDHSPFFAVEHSYTLYVYIFFSRLTRNKGSRLAGLAAADASDRPSSNIQHLYVACLVGAAVVITSSSVRIIMAILITNYMNKWKEENTSFDDIFLTRKVAGLDCVMKKKKSTEKKVASTLLSRWRRQKTNFQYFPCHWAAKTKLVVSLISLWQLLTLRKESNIIGRMLLFVSSTLIFFLWCENWAFYHKNSPLSLPGWHTSRQ